MLFCSEYLCVTMGRAKTISVDIRSKIIDFYKKGVKQSVIARNLIVSRSVVSSVVKNYTIRGHYLPKKQSGRPRKCSVQCDRRILHISKNNPFYSSTRIKAELDSGEPSDISSRTIRRRLVENNLRSFKPARKPLLSKKNVQARLEFAQAHISWSVDQWKRVVFSDESKFELFNSGGFRFVRRPKGERLNKKYICPTVKHGGGSIMVWGCFSGYSMGPIHRVIGIMDRFMYADILKNKLIPYTDETMPLKHIFQHDNDPKHRSQFVKSFLKEEKICVMEWPSQSPDLNPIENLWEYLERQIREKNYKNNDELFTALENAWKNIPMTTIHKLMESMPRRCAEVIKNGGYHTKY